MPSHEIGQASDFTRRFDNPYVRKRCHDLGQPSRHRYHQIGACDAENRGHEERNTPHRLSFQTEVCEGSIDRSLLSFPRFNDCVRKVQILFRRKSSWMLPLAPSYETNEVYYPRVLIGDGFEDQLIISIAKSQNFQR